MFGFSIRNKLVGTPKSTITKNYIIILLILEEL